GTRLALVEESGEILEGGELLVADDDGGGDAATGDFTATPIVIADRGLELRLDTPTTGMVLAPILIGLIGLILAVAISLVLLNWSRRERVALELAQRRVTERDRALQAEAETNKMYRLLAENLTDTVMVTDREARITYASPACESMMGWRPSELVGKLVIELLHPDEAEKGLSQYRQLLAEPGVVTFEHRVLCKDGEYVWVESAIRSVEDEEGRGEIVELQSTTRDISERKPLQDRLERLASEDSLTGLSNRRRFRESLEAELARSRRGGAVGSLLMIDIDNFKDFNDTYGHLVGDTVIQSVAEVLEERVRVSDTLARLGGDEFSAILPETDPGEAEVLAKAIVEAVGRHPVGHDLEPVTVSVGIASFGGGAELVADAVLTRADQAMYRAKRLGRNRIVRFDVTGDRDGDGTSVRPGQAAGTPAS
ncbi:MAG TPA: diguanylate cyclase, partial [Solirubrobacterales bacterium]|nr:diguanylate cyclase [Solirubrobacterales bacterium]